MLQVKRRAPLLDSSLPELAGAAEPQQYTLRLQLGRLMFEDHELFQQEHWHCSQLLRLYSDWQHLKSQMMAVTCAARIPIVRQELPHLKKEVRETTPLLHHAAERCAAAECCAARASWCCESAALSFINSGRDSFWSFGDSERPPGADAEIWKDRRLRIQRAVPQVDDFTGGAQVISAPAHSHGSACLSAAYPSGPTLVA